MRQKSFISLCRPLFARSWLSSSIAVSSSNRNLHHVPSAVFCNKNGHVKLTQSVFLSRNLCSQKPIKLANGLTRYLPRKRTLRRVEDALPKDGHWRVVAYASAEEIDLEKLMDGLLKQGLYETSHLPEDCEDALRIAAKYKVSEELRDIYLFRDGCIVFWNVHEIERAAFLSFLKPFSKNVYDENLTKDEAEIMEYSYADNGPRLTKGKFYLKSDKLGTDLTKYTFSNGMALSVKLGIWENALEQFVENVEGITLDLKGGRPIKLNRDQVLRKLGELFALRHILNLSSDLLDTPDFYWEREDLEPLFQKTCSHLNLAKRTRVLNERLNHCQELMQLLNDRLTDQHHVRLEVMIIALITIEVMFEIVHWII